MSKENNDLETITVKINPDFIRLINSKTNNKNIDETKLFDQCIQTGLRLSEINTIFRKKMIEESAFQKQLLEAYGDRKKYSNHVANDLKQIRDSSKEEKINNKSISQYKTDEKKCYKTLKVRVNQDFYEEIKTTSDKFGVEVSTFIRFCIRTGLYLEDLNLYLQKKDKEI